MKDGKTTIGATTSHKFELMSFICSVLVVCIHIQRPSTCSHFFQWFSKCFCSIAVPYFFMASGFFVMARACEDGWWGKALRKRVHTLIIPFYCLNLLWIPLRWGTHWVGVRYFNASSFFKTVDPSIENF